MLENIIGLLDIVTAHFPSLVVYILLAIGTIKLMMTILSLKRFIAQNFLTTEHELFERY